VTCAAEEQAIWQQLHTDRIDLVLLDGEFASRLELCEEIRAHYHRAIILTAESGPISERVRALRDGADDVLSKLYNPTELLARIQAVMRRYDDDYLRIHSAYRSLAVGPLKLHPWGAGW
jgi:two-component system OmpR family response regulator